MVELLAGILTAVKNFFSPTVTTTVNVNVADPKKPHTKPNVMPAINIDGNDVGSINKIDSEALSDFISELKYSKREKDNINVKLGNDKYNLEEI